LEHSSRANDSGDEILAFTRGFVGLLAGEIALLDMAAACFALPLESARPRTPSGSDNQVGQLLGPPNELGVPEVAVVDVTDRIFS
jgi:hypothetical protein